LYTGLANLAHWYPWRFGFTVAHFWTAWIVIGSLVAHVGAKLAITRRSLGATAKIAARASQPPGGGLDRRGFIGAVAPAAAAVTLTTAGQTLRPLRNLALFAPR